jgi:hypothetical protein
MEYVQAIGTDKEKELLAMVEQAGIVEEEEEEEDTEDTNEAINWDEWMIDQRIDDLRDAIMAHER